MSQHDDNPNRPNGADALVSLLKAFDVDTVFGLCGDTSLPFYDALYRDGDGINHVLTRDERHAAYMADGYARVTGKVGVCEGPSGGGATYILPGLVEANESSIPVLAITTDVSVTGRGRYTLTELDQEALMRPLTKWNSVIDHAASLPGAVRAAFAAMSTGKPGSTHIGLPLDVQRTPVDAASVWGNRAHGRFPASRSGPDADAVSAARAALDRAQRPLIICGGGVLLSSGEEELAQFAERTGAAVATTVSGQGSIAETHPLSVGVVGSNGGTPATRAIVDEADLIIFLCCRAGSVTTERWQHPVPGSVPVIQIDVDPAVIGVNYDVDVAMVSDAKLALAALTQAATAADPDRVQAMQARLEKMRAEKYAVFDELAGSSDTPIKPERLVQALQNVLDDSAIIVADPGTPCPYFSGYYRWPRAGRHFITNRAHGALGFALAASMGAQIGRPESQVVCVMGDGSFAMAAGELETVKRLGLPIVMIVVSNAVFGWIKAGQKSNFDERYFSVDFSRTDHAAVAGAYGIRNYTVTDPVALESVLAEATGAREPVMIDVICQPLEEANAPVSEWIA